MEQLGSLWMDFRKILHLSIFQISVEKIQRPVLLRIKKMFQTKVAEKLETHLMFNNFFFLENRVVYEIVWKSVVERGRP